VGSVVCFAVKKTLFRNWRPHRLTHYRSAANRTMAGILPRARDCQSNRAEHSPVHAPDAIGLRTLSGPVGRLVGFRPYWNHSPMPTMNHERRKHTLAFVLSLDGDEFQQATELVGSLLVPKYCTNNCADVETSHAHSTGWLSPSPALKSLASAVQLRPWPPFFQRTWTFSLSLSLSLPRTLRREPHCSHPPPKPR
jgi:hypothetical protein